MKIHEYQGKEILRQFGVPVPRGYPAFSVLEASEAAQKLGGPVWVVKAQIHAGGRGKGGGVKLARSIEDVKKLAGEILGMQLVTHQTGPEGQKVRRLLIEDGADIKKEYYVSAVTDRASQRVAMIVSSEGGMDIEEVAHSTPEKIVTEIVDPATGLTVEQATKLANAIGVPAGSVAQAADVLQKVYKVYMDTDASLVEINPMILEGNGGIKAIDAKFNFDANALYRHPEIVAYRDLDEEDPAEVEASKFDHQAVWRRTRQLPGRGRRCHPREGHRSLQDHAQKPQGQGHFGQHLWRHHEVRHHRHRRHHRLQGDQPECAAGGAHEGHQRRTGQEDAGRVWPAHHQRRHHGRCGPKSGRRRQSRSLRLNRKHHVHPHQ